MRFKDLRAKGIGPFREEIYVDFSAIDGQLVVVCGDNGEGKTTLLECLGGGIYRDCPTRGSLADLATARDSFVEVGVVNGSAYHIRQTIDAISKKGETLITTADGHPVTSTGKVSEADKYIAKHLPSPDVVYASTFAAQGSGGFLDLTAGERKSVVLKALGIERLETLAKRARKKADELGKELVVLTARENDERARASDPKVVSAALEGLRAQIAEASEAVAKQRELFESARAAEQLARIAERDLETYEQRQAEITTSMQQVIAESTDLERRIDNNRGVMSRGEEIRAAQERTAAIAGEIVELTAKADALILEGRAADAACLEERQRSTRIAAQIATEEGRVTSAERLLVERERVETAVAELPSLREQADTAKAVTDAAQSELESIQSVALEGADDRNRRLRRALIDIAQLEELAKSRDIARAAIDHDDGMTRQAAEAPSRIKRLREALALTVTRERDARAAVATAEKLAAMAPSIVAAAETLSAAREAIAVLAEERKQLDQRSADAFERSKTACEHERSARLRVSELRAEREQLAPIVALAERHAQAEARLTELESRLAQLRTKAVELRAAADALGDRPEVPVRPDIEGMRVRVELVESTLRSLEARVAVTEAQLVDATASAERLESMGAKRSVLEADLADYQRLADDLGKDGIQALEVDAAGPEITTITNDLLHEAFGSRFSVRFETTRRASDGKRDLEEFEICVLDSEKGRDGEAWSFSGGERVILSEAIALALSTLACRRNNVERPTIVRDESGAALDEARARKYIAMLRRAGDLVQADKILLVTHSAELKALADARIEIANGKVTVAA